MSRSTRALLTLSVTAIVAGGLAVPAAPAQLQMTRHVIAAGGLHNQSGGSYVIRGTLGQHVATTSQSGTTYVLRSGFWTGDGSCAGDVNGDGAVNLRIWPVCSPPMVPVRVRAATTPGPT